MKNKLTNYMIKELAENFKKGFYIIPLYSRKKRIYNTLVIHNLENELGKCCRFFIIYNNSNELSYKETVRLDTTKSFDDLEESIVIEDIDNISNEYEYKKLEVNYLNESYILKEDILKDINNFLSNNTIDYNKNLKYMFFEKFPIIHPYVSIYVSNPLNNYIFTKIIDSYIIDNFLTYDKEWIIDVLKVDSFLINSSKGSTVKSKIFDNLRTDIRNFLKLIFDEELVLYSILASELKEHIIAVFFTIKDINYEWIISPDFLNEDVVMKKEALSLLQAIHDEDKRLYSTNKKICTSYYNFKDDLYIFLKSRNNYILTLNQDYDLIKIFLEKWFIQNN